MIEKIMESKRITKIVDEQILPLVKEFRQEEDHTVKLSIALNLLEFEDIFEYHYPSDFKDCNTHVTSYTGS